MVTKPWCSIIIPTLSEDPPTLHNFEPRRLTEEGIELIVVRDRWGNASRARNIGAAAAMGRVLCFLDDDVGVETEQFLKLLKFYNRFNNSFIWHDPPHLLIIKSDFFFDVGGYDERLKPTMGETVELKLRLLRKGLTTSQLEPQSIKLEHLKQAANPRYLLNQKHLTWVYLIYRNLPLHKLILRKNPIELIRRVKWVLEWLLYRRWMRRSIFT